MRCSTLLVCLGFSTSFVFADDSVVATTEPAPTPAPPPSTMVAAPAPAPVEADTGSRLRNGFSLSAGQEWGSGPSSGFSAQLFGGDWRIGMQMTDAIGVYLQSHLSFGNGEIGAAKGSTGNLAFALMGEYTLPMRLFFAGGGGYGILNNPDGPLAQARVGYYPFETHSTSKVRRLNVAMDARWYFPGDQIGTVTQLSLTVGYDRF